MCPNNADRMENSVDPDQIAPLGKKFLESGKNYMPAQDKAIKMTCTV